MAAMTEGATTQVYRASGGRRAALTIVALLLTPFFISMIPMVIWRLSRGLIADASYLLVVAIVYGLLLLLLWTIVVYSYRSRIEIGDNAVRLVVPRHHRPAPSFSYIDKVVPYSEIDRLETRGEILRTLGVPSLLRATTLVTKSGERLHLGYTHEGSDDPALPLKRIADEVARRAGVSVKQKAGIKVDTRTRLIERDPPVWEKSEDLTDDIAKLEQETYDALVARNHRTMFYVAFLVIGLAFVIFFVELGKSGLLNSPG
jgi:hypothetical protein